MTHTAEQLAKKKRELEEKVETLSVENVAMDKMAARLQNSVTDNTVIGVSGSREVSFSVIRCGTIPAALNQ
jgi:hypothetical protein